MTLKKFKKPDEFKPKDTAKVKLVYFSQGRIALNQECTRHSTAFIANGFARP